MKKFYQILFLVFFLVSCHIFKTDFKDSKDILKWTLDSLSKPFIGSVEYDEFIPYVKDNENKNIYMLQTETLQQIFLKIVNPRKIKINLTAVIKEADQFLIDGVPNITIEDKETYTEAKISVRLKKEVDKRNLDILILLEKDNREKLDPLNLLIRINQKPNGVARYNDTKLLSVADIWNVSYVAGDKKAIIKWDLNKGELDTDIKNFVIKWEKNGVLSKEELLPLDKKEYELSNVMADDKIKFYLCVEDDEGLRSDVFATGEKQPSVFAGGDGTVANPYKVSDSQQLDRVRYYADKHFIQTADIDLNGFSNWSPIQDFKGSYDGGNFKINNLKIDRETESNVALFSSIEDFAGLKNIRLKNVFIKGKDSVGGIVGVKEGDDLISIENCSVEGGEISSEIGNIGGIIGKTAEGPIAIKRCWNSSKISGEKCAGIIASATGDVTIEECYNLGNILGESTAGILYSAGKTMKLDSCYNLGKISGSSQSVGIFGIISATGKISNSYNLGAIFHKANQIFILEQVNSPTIENCYGIEKKVDWFMAEEAITTLGNTVWMQSNTISQFPVLKNNLQTVDTKNILVILTVSNSEFSGLYGTLFVDDVSQPNGESTLKFIKGMSATINYNPPSNYEFSGWTGVVDSNNPLTVELDTGKNISPKVLGKTFSITFDANGGVGTMVAQNIRYKESASLSKNIFTKTGNNFLGWSETASATAKSWGDEALFEMAGNTTLYAVWELKKFTLTVTAPATGLGTIAIKKGTETLDTTQPIQIEYSTPLTATATATNSATTVFDSWTGTVTSTENPFSFNMTQDITLGAKFGKIEPVTSVSASGNIENVSLAMYNGSIYYSTITSSGATKKVEVRKVTDMGAPIYSLPLDGGISTKLITTPTAMYLMEFLSESMSCDFKLKKFNGNTFGSDLVGANGSIGEHGDEPTIFYAEPSLHFIKYESNGTSADVWKEQNDVFQKISDIPAIPTANNYIPDCFIATRGGDYFWGFTYNNKFQCYKNGAEAPLSDFNYNTYSTITGKNLNSCNLDGKIFFSYSSIKTSDSTCDGTFIQELGSSSATITISTQETKFNVLAGSSDVYMYCLYYEGTNLKLAKVSNNVKKDLLNVENSSTEAVVDAKMVVLGEVTYIAYITSQGATKNLKMRQYKLY